MMIEVMISYLNSTLIVLTRKTAEEQCLLRSLRQLIAHMKIRLVLINLVI